MRKEDRVPSKPSRQEMTREPDQKRIRRPKRNCRSSIASRASFGGGDGAKTTEILNRAIGPIA